MEKFEDFDNDLQSMVNYSDKTVPAAMPVMEQKARPKAEQQSEPAKDEAMDAAYAVLTQKPRDLIDRLFGMTKWMGICGGICMLLWRFEVNGLMAMEAAYPCILVSAMVGTAGAVWNAK